MLESSLTFLAALVLLIIALHQAIFRPGPDRGLDKVRSVSLLGTTVRFRLTHINSKKFWKSIDYVWLSLAALGVLIAVGSVRRNEAAISVEQTKHEMVRLLAVIRPDVRGICRQYGFDFEGCGWILNVDNAIEKARLSVDWPLDTDTNWEGLARDAPVVEHYHAIFAKADQLIPVLQENLRKAQRLKQDGLRMASSARVSDTEHAILRIWPFLLVMAIALRWTKVTGERRLENL